MLESQKTIESRLKYLGVFVILMSLILLWRMADIQIFQHSQYLAKAQGQQRFDKPQMAERGKILVHDSAVNENVYYPLAFDVKKFALWAVPQHIKDKENTAKELESFVGIKSDEIFQKINNDKLYIPPLKHGLTLDQANQITAKKLSGVMVMPEYSRFYPEGIMAAHLLGFVNSEGDGKYGFEGHYNNELKGKEGNVTGEKDTLGRIINLLEQNDPQNGASYVLTLDRSVQYFVEKKLKEAIDLYQAESGSVVIMDIKTGGILAMANLPSFDPNNYMDQANIDAGLFVNPAIAYLFEPGSIFKPIVMAGAMDHGDITPDTKGNFSNMTTINGYEIHTAEDKAFGEETMTQVLENSDNVAMAWLSQKMGKQLVYDTIKKFNFTEKTGIDLDTEVVGRTAPFKEWKDIHAATIAFGQGISVTSLSLVSAYASIANGGKYIYPHVVDKVIYNDGSEKTIVKQEGEQIISEATAKQMATMLASVVSNGHAKKAGVPGFQVAAKTGTAQIPDPAGGYLKNDSGMGIYIHSLAGFAPADSPRYAMLVKLDKPKTVKYAESSAAPLFGEISSFLLNYHYRLVPNQ